MFRTLAPLLLALGLAQPALADGGRSHDHDDAQEALLRAEVLPLAQVLAAVEAQFKGRVIEVEFERSGGHYVYEFELITADGRIIEVEVDAASGQVLEIEGDPGTAPDEGAVDAGIGGRG